MEGRNPISSQWVEVNGMRIHYFQTGHGPHVLLLLPGALGAATVDFKKQLENLSDEFTMIAPDYRGLGLSRPPFRDWPGNFYKRDADDMAKFMEAIGKHHYSILGICAGGTVGLIIAGTYPERVRKLAVLGARAFVKEKDMAVAEGNRDVARWSEIHRQPAVDFYGREELLRIVDLSIDAVVRYYKETGGDLCTAEVEKIRCPTFLISSAMDHMILDYHEQYLNKTIPNSIAYNFPGGDHLPNLTNHLEFNERVEKFLLGEGSMNSV